LIKNTKFGKDDLNSHMLAIENLTTMNKHEITRL